MPRWFIKILVVSAGAVVTFLLLAVMAKLMVVYPVDQVTAIETRFWASHDGSLPNQLKYYLYLLLENWMLWGVLIIGFLGTILVWRRYTDEELNVYLERLYILERELQDAEVREKRLETLWEQQDIALDTLFSEASENWLVVDKQAKVLRSNRAFLDLVRRFHPQLEVVEGRLLSEVLPGFNNTSLYKAVHEAANARKPWYGEIKLGEDLFLLVWLWPMEDRVAMVLRDVTHRRRPEAYLQSAEKLSRQLVEDSVRPVAVLDMEWRYLMVSRRWAEVLGVPDGKSLVGLRHEDVMPDFPRDLGVARQQLIAGELVGREDERRVINGHEEVLSWHIRPWRDAFGRDAGFIFTVVPVTELVRLRAQIAQSHERENALAYSDMLTGLPNRQLFSDRLNMSLAQAYRQLGKVALLFLDLDGFKAINDNLGHDYGDLLLKGVAERLKTCVRQTDTVARLGGDEFTMILSIRDKADAEQVAKKVLKTIMEPFDLGGTPARVGTSIGIALYPQDATTATELLGLADRAMYAAKEGGKNTYRFAVKEKEDEKKSGQAKPAAPAEDKAAGDLEES
ncbi:MAG: hypothetical protein COY40_04540 [Alphaproteobacteria bacterium CG_4_10_14_0_8_um_filter_53_9]|nr:MAG: hypothetical protein COY40_04540 [Alphaproteobacteria bacterium CG_4_10_14_0_8_um_filter_53_9]